MADTPRFLSVEDVLRLHAIAIADHGGDPGIRDRGLLDSALAMPRQQFDGVYLHDGIAAMAAAYAFHICKNHAFIDGNKRAAAAAMIALLLDNGWSFDADADEAEPAFLSLAAGQTIKEAFAQWVSEKTHEKPRMELRDFFSNISYERFQERCSAFGMGSYDDFMVSLVEAKGVFPFLDVWESQVKAASENGRTDYSWWLLGQYSLLCALYRIAEDMGYEW